MTPDSMILFRAARQAYFLAPALLLGLLALLPGCASHPESDDEPLRPGPAGVRTVDGIQYQGELLVMESFPVQLSATVTVTNASGAPRTLEFPDGCVVLLRAYQGADRVWDQTRSVGCTQAIVSVPLTAGKSRTFRGRTDGYEVLGDSLPDGLYRMTAYLRPDGNVVELELGETDLAIPRD
jgi:hypothetical protein